MAHFFPSFWCLTGTPIQNTVADIFDRVVAVYVGQALVVPVLGCELQEERGQEDIEEHLAGTPLEFGVNARGGAGSSRSCTRCAARCRRR